MVLFKTQPDATSNSPMLGAILDNLLSLALNQKQEQLQLKLLAMKEKREKLDLVFLTIAALELKAKEEIATLMTLQVSLSEVETMAQQFNCRQAMNYLILEKRKLDFAILENDVAVFEKYIAQNKHWLFYQHQSGLPSVNPDNMRSALELIIKNNKVELLSSLLKFLSEKTKLSQKEIIESCRLAHMAIDLEAEGSLRFLLEAGVDINAPSKRGDTLLHYAVLRQSAMIIVLLANKADPKLLDKANNSVLHTACQNASKPPVIELLIKDSNLLQKNVHFKSADEIDKSGYFKLKKGQLLTAIRQGNLPVIEEYAAQNIDWLKIPLEEDRSALLVAAQLDEISSFDKILDLLHKKTGIAVNEIVDNTFSKGETWRFARDDLPRHNALSLAVTSGAPRVFNRLLALRADLNITHALHCAVYYGESETAMKLINHGARLIRRTASQRPDEISCAYFKQNCLQDLKKALCQAALEGNALVIERYLAQNKDWLILPLNETNQSLLHLLAYYNHHALIESFLSNPEYTQIVKLAERDEYGIYPQQYAAFHKNQESYRLLQREESFSLLQFHRDIIFVISRFKNQWPSSLSQQVLKNPVMIYDLMEVPEFFENISEDSVITLIKAEPTIIPLLLEEQRSRHFLTNIFAKNRRFLLDFILNLPQKCFLAYEPLLKEMIVKSSLSFFERVFSYLNGDYAEQLKTRQLKNFVQLLKEENSSHAALLHGLIMERGLFEQVPNPQLAVSSYQQVLAEANGTQDYFEAQYGLAQCAYLEHDLPCLHKSFQNMLTAKVQGTMAQTKFEHILILQELLELKPTLTFQEKAEKEPSKEAVASLPQNALPELKPL